MCRPPMLELRYYDRRQFRGDNPDAKNLMRNQLDDWRSLKEQTPPKSRLFSLLPPSATSNNCGRT